MSIVSLHLQTFEKKQCRHKPETYLCNAYLGYFAKASVPVLVSGLIYGLNYRTLKIGTWSH